MARYKKEDVLRALHQTEWRKTLDVRKRMSELPDRSGEPSIGFVYAALDEYVHEGWVESREAQLTPEEFARRGNRKANEYRLTNSGVREQAAAGERSGARTRRINGLRLRPA